MDVRSPSSSAILKQRWSPRGLLGRTYLGLVTVERFFLPEDLRRNRLGSRILGMAEEEARRRGCTRAVLSTLHFQAPGFYLKQGWEGEAADRYWDMRRGILGRPAAGGGVRGLSEL